MSNCMRACWRGTRRCPKPGCTAGALDHDRHPLRRLGTERLAAARSAARHARAGPVRRAPGVAYVADIADGHPLAAGGGDRWRAAADPPGDLPGVVGVA